MEYKSKWASILIEPVYAGKIRWFQCANALIIDGNYVGVTAREDSTFENATIIDTDLRGASLSFANFAGAQLYGCDLRGAELPANFVAVTVRVDCEMPAGYEDEEDEEDGDED